MEKNKGVPTFGRTKRRSNAVRTMLATDEQSIHGNEATQKQDTNICHVTTSENNSITCRSSPVHVVPIMDKFDETKRSLVRSIGFGGLLDLPHINKINRKFSLWLLSRTKWTSNSIEIGNIRMHIVDEDIQRIIGTPASGKDVKSAMEGMEKKFFLDSKLSFLGDEHSLISSAESFVKTDLPSPLTKQSEDQFKVSFLIFMMGRFLAPSTDYYTGNSDFWGALSEPDQIINYNWSAYILSHIIDSAASIEFAKLSKQPINSITGCPLLMQVFYLDNLDLGPLNLPHNVFPRISAFDCNTLSRMIEADSSHGLGQMGLSFGLSRVRESVDSCYSFQKERISIQRSIQSQAPKEKKLPDEINAMQTQTPKSNTPKPKKPIVPANSPFSTPNPPPSSTINAKNHNALNPGTPDFPSYLRNKYPNYQDNFVIDALKYHNARCIQIAHKAKISLTAAFVKENMDLADKYMEHYCKQVANSAAAPARNMSNDRRRTYEDLLSGPESGNEGEDSGGRARHERLIFPDIGTSTNKMKTMKTASIDNWNDGTQEHPRMGCSKTKYQRCTGSAPSSSLVLSQTQKQQPNTPSGQINSDTNYFQERPGISKMSGSPVSFGIKSEGSTDCFTPAPTSKMIPVSPQLSTSTDNIVIPIAGVDLNARFIDIEYTNPSYKKKVVKLGRFAKSHWAMGVDHPDRDTTVTHSLFDWLSTTNTDELENYWIIHELPYPVKATGHDLKRGFTGGRGIGYELFDIAIRRIKHLDSYIYQSDIPLRWRHMFESDFALRCIENTSPIENASIREQFIGASVDYELHRCRMMMVPVIQKGSWSCYVWDLREHVVSIIDPTAGMYDEDFILMVHSSTIKLLEESIKFCVRNFFSGWGMEVGEFSKTVVRISDRPCTRAESGIYTLFCMKNFDGKGKIHTTDAIIQKFKEYMLYETFGLKPNGGILPSVYVESIDD